MASATYVDLLTEVKPRPIRSEREHNRALAIVEKLMDKPHKTVAEKDMIELLATLIDQYEELHSPTPDFSPGEMLKFFLEQRKLSQTELARQTGIPQSTIANVIAGRRQLSKSGVSILSKFFKMSPTIFME
jgi:HTH-type transcriptional regulator/antitoxin HigA